MEHKALAEEFFRAGYNCAQAVVVAFHDTLGISERQAARLSSSFGGGMGRMRAEYCDLIDDVDPNLTLEGLRLIYENNREAFENRKLDMNNSVIEVTEEGAWQENK